MDWVITKELNRVPKYNVSTLYMLADGPYYTNLAYLKETYIILKVNIYRTCCITLSF